MVDYQWSLSVIPYRYGMNGAGGFQSLKPKINLIWGEGNICVHPNSGCQ